MADDQAFYRRHQSQVLPQLCICHAEQPQCGLRNTVCACSKSFRGFAVENDHSDSWTAQWA